MPPSERMLFVVMIHSLLTDILTSLLALGMFCQAADWQTELLNTSPVTSFELLPFLSARPDLLYPLSGWTWRNSAQNLWSFGGFCLYRWNWNSGHWLQIRSWCEQEVLVLEIWIQRFLWSLIDPVVPGHRGQHRELLAVDPQVRGIEVGRVDREYRIEVPPSTLSWPWGSMQISS